MASGKTSFLVCCGASTAAFAGMLVGGVWIVAWRLGVVSHWSATGMLTMKINAAVGVLLAGLALILLTPDKDTDTITLPRRRVGIVAAFLVLLIGGLTLAELLLGYNFGIDQLLASESLGAVATSSPGRMGPPAAICLTMLGLGLLALATRILSAVTPYLGLAVCAITFVPAVGYLYGATNLYSDSFFTAIAWSTVAALMSLGLGLICAHQESGPVLLLLRDDPGGILVRRLLPAAILSPLILGYLRTLGERAGLYNTVTGRSLLVISMAVILSVLLWESGWRLSKAAAVQTQVEQALRQSEEQFRTLSNWIPQLAWMANGDGWIFWFNQRWYQYTGTTPDEMEGWGWQSVYDAKMLPKVMEQWRASIATGEPVDEVFSLRGTDGLFHPFLTRVIAIKDADGKVTRWFGTHTDISQQKQIETQLRQSNARLDLAMSTVNMGEWELNLETLTVMRSPRHDQIFGYKSPLPVWTHETFLSHVLPQYRDAVQAKAQASLTSGVWDIEVPISRRDGVVRWIWVRGRTLLDEMGRPTSAIGTIIDTTERRQAEQHIAHLASFPELNPHAIFETDLDGKVTYLNPAAQRQFPSFRNADAHHVLLDGWSSIIASLQSSEETSLIREVQSDGRDFLQTIHCSPELGVIRAYMTDLTGHKSAERELRASQERLAAIVGSAMDAVITLDSNQCIVVFNAAAERIFRCTAKEALYKPIDRFIPEQLRSFHRRNIAGFSNTGESSRSMVAPRTLYGLRADGEQFPLEAAISRVQVGGNDLLTIILRDITRREQAERELREKEERFRSLFEHAAVGIEQVSTNGRLLMVNPALCNMLQYSEAELLGKTYFEITHPDDREREKEMRDSLFSGECTFYEIEKRYLRRNGSSVWVNLTSSLVKDIAGIPLYRISIIQNITENRRAEEQLQQAQKMEAIGRLAGGVAHDFNTLLGVILGYSELALAELPKSNPSRKRIEHIEQSARAGALLTKQLLAFSRSQAISMQTVDIKETVLSLEPMLRRLLSEDIEILVRSSPEACPVKGDPVQLQQVVLNLAVNAGQAMPRGGTLTIDIRPVRDNEIQKLATLPLAQYSMLTVTDTGTGMDSETVSQIFEPFFTTKPVGEGTGLGLATVYGIVKQAGGDISVSSQLGVGTTFRVSFPSSLQTQIQTIGTSNCNHEKLTGTETILLVEDSAPLRDLTREILARKGYSIIEAEDGVQALELSRTHSGPIHLLITDIVMPRMRGPELAERILKERPDLAILFMSGYAADSFPGIPQLGRIKSLEKPCKSEVLLQTVRQVLDATRLESSSIQKTG